MRCNVTLGGASYFLGALLFEAQSKQDQPAPE